MTVLTSNLLFVSLSLLIALVTLTLSIYWVGSRSHERKLAWLDLNENEKNQLFTLYYNSWKTGGYNARAYLLAPQLALNDNEADVNRVVRVARRAVKIDQLRETEQGEWDALAVQWLSSVGAFAREAHSSRVALRAYLQTNHLAIIREGVIIEPALVRQLATNSLGESQRRDATWGIALFLLCVKYHRYSPVQRDAVYIERANSSGGKNLYGPILSSGVPKWMGRLPTRLHRHLLDAIDSCRPYYGLRDGQFTKAERELSDMALEYRKLISA
jgi:hypothetical protein